MFDAPTGTGNSEIALTACKVTGAGSGAMLACGQPVVVASSTFCRNLHFGNRTFAFCNFLDKPFIAIDPARHRLHATFTEFPNNVGGIRRYARSNSRIRGSAASTTDPAGLRMLRRAAAGQR